MRFIRLILRMILGYRYYINPINHLLKKRQEEKELRDFAKSFYKNMRAG